MNFSRAIKSGMIVWVIVLSFFLSSMLIPKLEDSNLTENLALILSLIPSVYIGVLYYYKGGNNTKGIYLSMVMISTALLLDSIITLPLFIIPYGGSYLEFFTSTITWVVIFEYFLLVLIIEKINYKNHLKINRRNNFMENKKVLVLGGKGKTGRKVVSRLTNLGLKVRIGSRSENPPFDWDNFETWSNALQDIDNVYITYQPDLAVPSAVDSIRKFTNLAVKMGIKKIVLLSGRGEKEAQVCEKIVMNSGVDWTIVRASWFFQNFSESFFLDPILAGQIVLPRGNVPEPFIDTDDIADVVVEALLHENHNGQIYELTGPRLLTFEQIAKDLTSLLNREISFTPISIDEYVKILKEFSIPEDYIWLIEYLFTNVLDGRNSYVTHDVEKVLGRKAKDFSKYANEMIDAGIWNQTN